MNKISLLLWKFCINSIYRRQLFGLCFRSGSTSALDTDPEGVKFSQNGGENGARQQIVYHKKLTVSIFETMDV
jgi:hypothetical protein